MPFSFAQLEAATCGFAGEGYLGEGGFGRVHKGTLVSRGGRRLDVAVKVLDVGGDQVKPVMHRSVKLHCSALPCCP